VLVVIHGHNVNSLESPLIEEPAPGAFCYGLDTGCCFGGRLSALILETKEIVQVPAKRIYYKAGFNS
jgi:bis(5'-nucleosyl)-tetraphosphatase (symmetrical)